MTLKLPPVPNTYGVPHGLHLGIPMQPGEAAVTAAMDNFIIDPRIHTWYNWSQHADVPMVYSVLSIGSMNAIREAIDRGDTNLWLIENEPSNVNEPSGQSRSLPLDVANAMKEIDGKIPWAGFGLLVNYNTSYWSRWLVQYFAAGGPMPDVWHIHVYSDFPQTWSLQLKDFAEWTIMTGRQRPIIITECGGWPRNPMDEQAIIMEKIVETMINGIKVKVGGIDYTIPLDIVFWFSSFYPLWKPGDLLRRVSETEYVKSWLGEKFMEAREAIKIGPPLPPDPPPDPTDPPPDSGHTIHLPSVHG